MDEPRHRMIDRVPTTHDRSRRLETSPHYTDHRFDYPQTVFGDLDPTGEGHPGLHYAYSDRLEEWDRAKSEASWEAARRSGAPARSARFYDAYLIAYYGKPIEVRHVLAGVNVSSGYPYFVLGYVELGAAPPQPATRKPAVRKVAAKRQRQP